MNVDTKLKRPKMDPVALLELSVLAAELQARVAALAPLVDSHPRPGSMRLVVSALERTSQRFQIMRADCEVLL